MPLFHMDAETLEHVSTHHAMEKLSKWFNPTSQNEGGNYVLTRNDSNYIGGISIIVQDALTFTASGKLGTIGGQAGQGFTLDGTPVTAQFSIDLDTARATLNWTVANGTPQSATIVLILYREAPAINSVAFYADKASDKAAYSLNILML
jgi:hypothetical protein